MRTILVLGNLFLIIAMLDGSNSTKAKTNGTTGAVPENYHAASINSLAGVTIDVKAANDATIFFKSESGNEVDAPESDGQQIPHLVLNRNGVPTPGYERTLHFSLGSLIVPPSGLYARLVIETQHDDPDQTHQNAEPIRVWQDTKFIPYAGKSQEPISVDFNVVFQRSFQHQTELMRTPTDYYNYQIILFDPQGNELREIRKEYAFLMENQWRVPLPMVLEASPGAAPNELLVYFYDMIPFKANPRDPDSRIPRHDVERYIQIELIPAMVAAFETQSNLWEMPWYSEWTSYRPEEDAKTLSVALVEYKTWFHGAPTTLGHALISIRVDGSFGTYPNLTDGIMSVFHHELFHSQQRSLSLHLANNGNIAGRDDAWKIFSEGTAALTSLVANPGVEFGANSGLRRYVKRANAYLGADGISDGSSNKSYSLIPYETALYWRFLYEKCGGLNEGREDPSTGMKVIRHALEALYGGEIVDIYSSTDMIGAFPDVLDAALQATPACEFQTYNESLVHFARAIYQLRLDDGRCPVSGEPATCGFFDPYRLYQSPLIKNYLITGDSEIKIQDSIPTSYGIDILELGIDTALEGKSLTIIFESNFNDSYQFSVEVLKLKTSYSESHLERYAFEGQKVNIQTNGNSLESRVSQIGNPLSARVENGYQVMRIENRGADDINGLALIITRMDTNETSERMGDYTIQVVVE